MTVAPQKPAQYGYRTTANPSGDSGVRLSRLVLDEIRRRDTGKDVCDLGCGNGYFAGLLADEGFKVVGLDASESGIEIAQERFGACAEFLCRSIDADLVGHLGESRFDVVVSSEVIEHLYRPRDLLEVAFALLRPRGLLILTTPYHGYLKNLAIAGFGKFDSHVDPLWDGGHIKFFSRRTLFDLVIGCGFRDVEFSFFGRVPFLWKSMICTARKP